MMKSLLLFKQGLNAIDNQIFIAVTLSTKTLHDPAQQLSGYCVRPSKCAATRLAVCTNSYKNLIDKQIRNRVRDSNRGTEMARVQDNVKRSRV